MTGQVARIDDAWTDPLYEKKQEAKVGKGRSMIGVPLMREGEPIGVIGLGGVSGGGRGLRRRNQGKVGCWAGSPGSRRARTPLILLKFLFVWGGGSGGWGGEGGGKGGGGKALGGGGGGAPLGGGGGEEGVLWGLAGGRGGFSGDTGCVWACGRGGGGGDGGGGGGGKGRRQGTAFPEVKEKMFNPFLGR